MSGRGKGKGTGKKNVTKSTKAGLQFPVGRIARYLKKGRYAGERSGHSVGAGGGGIAQHSGGRSWAAKGALKFGLPLCQTSYRSCKLSSRRSLPLQAVADCAPEADCAPCSASLPLHSLK